MAQTSDALKIIKKMIKDDPQMQEMVEEASLNAQVAQIIYDARKQAGLTQSVIARWEDADYEGHSFSMLARIATALNRKLEIDMPPTEIAKS
jgi:ribosome-binding protein aMBF1 (putative translation factor)